MAHHHCDNNHEHHESSIHSRRHDDNDDDDNDDDDTNDADQDAVTAERKHFNDVVNAFRQYEHYSRAVLAMRRRHFEALPARHQVN